MYFVFFYAIKVCKGDLRRKEAKTGMWSISEVLHCAIGANTLAGTCTQVCVLTFESAKAILICGVRC